VAGLGLRVKREGPLIGQERQDIIAQGTCLFQTRRAGKFRFITDGPSYVVGLLALCWVVEGLGWAFLIEWDVQAA
jgi:hypothetical protein